MWAGATHPGAHRSFDDDAHRESGLSRRWRRTTPFSERRSAGALNLLLHDLQRLLGRVSRASAATGAPVACFIHRSGVSLPCLAMRSNSAPRLPAFSHLLLDLERDQVADRVVGQVEERCRSCASRRRAARRRAARRPGRSTGSRRRVAICQRRLAQLGRRGVGVLVHPVPDAHVDERHAGDLVGAPEVVERLQRVGASGVGLGEARAARGRAPGTRTRAPR